MSTTQPEALRLADALDGNATTNWTREEAAAELRRLHHENAHADRYAEQLGRELAKATAEIADLRARLVAIGAGGVSPLMGAAGDAGWVMVPVDPTPEMCAVASIDEGARITDGPVFAAYLYSAMLAASPPATSSAKGVAHG